MKGTLALLAVLGTALPVRLAGQDAGALLREASRVYRNLTSLQADFEQVIEDRMLVDTLTSRGTLLQAGEAKLSMRFRDPEGDLIVSDGRHVWFFLPSSAPNQVIRMPVPSDPVYGPNMLARVLDRPEERYRSQYLGVDTLDGHPTHKIELHPLSDDPPFTRAVVWLDRVTSLPRRIDLDEPSGQHRRLLLRAIRPNVPVLPSAFRFDPPRGVRIVDQ